MKLVFSIFTFQHHFWATPSKFKELSCNTTLSQYLSHWERYHHHLWNHGENLLTLIFNTFSIQKVHFILFYFSSEGSFLYVVPYFMNTSSVVVPLWGCGCSSDYCLSSLPSVSLLPLIQAAWCCGEDSSQSLACKIQYTEGNSVWLLLNILTYN